jgi:hypothetical protein
MAAFVNDADVWAPIGTLGNARFRPISDIKKVDLHSAKEAKDEGKD